MVVVRFRLQFAFVPHFSLVIQSNSMAAHFDDSLNELYRVMSRGFDQEAYDTVIWKNNGKQSYMQRHGRNRFG